MKKASKWTKKCTLDSVGNTLQRDSGGGLGILFIGLAVILVAFIVFINIADYSLYTYKRNTIKKGMDYAVTAAVQQLNQNQSIVGVSNGFAEGTGEKLLEDVEIDIDRAKKTFLTIFYSNYNGDSLNIDESLLVCATAEVDNKLQYTIKADTEQVYKGSLENSIEIEGRINQAINQVWPSAGNNSQVYIVGNPKTNIPENGTYLFAFLKDIKVTGIFSQRQISLSSFAGAKLER